MSRDITKQTKWLCAPAKTQISLGIRPIWSESSLTAWRNFGSLATQWAHSKDSDQTGRMPRLIWVFAGRTIILLVLPCRGSYILIYLESNSFLRLLETNGRGDNQVGGLFHNVVACYRNLSSDYAEKTSCLHSCKSYRFMIPIKVNKKLRKGYQNVGLDRPGFQKFVNNLRNF